MPLTDAAIRKAKPKEKPYKLSDAGGLFLWVQPAGGKWWRYKYRYGGKEKSLALGPYPDVSLAHARERHSQARKMLSAGKDPADAKREAKRLAILKNENSFEAVARDWCENRRHTWVTSYGEAMMTRLEHHVFPRLGTRPITEITAPELLSVYGHIPAEGVQAIGDFDTREHAEEVFTRITGRKY